MHFGRILRNQRTERNEKKQKIYTKYSHDETDSHITFSSNPHFCPKQNPQSVTVEWYDERLSILDGCSPLVDLEHLLSMFPRKKNLENSNRWRSNRQDNEMFLLALHLDINERQLINLKCNLQSPHRFAFDSKIIKFRI